MIVHVQCDPVIQEDGCEEHEGGMPRAGKIEHDAANEDQDVPGSRGNEEVGEEKDRKKNENETRRAEYHFIRMIPDAITMQALIAAPDRSEWSSYAATGRKESSRS
jgi:hypothetical protein